jgi:hypothetical protein
MSSSNTISALIVTHSNRIEQFLKMFDVGKIHVNNCSVIKITLFHGLIHKYITIDQIWDGATEIHNEILKKTQISILGTFSKSFLKGYEIKKGNLYFFYIIRHGQGYHNLFSNKLKNLVETDPELTELGINQSRNTGRFLQSYISNKIDFYFVSTLLRSHQTMLYLLETFLVGNNGKVVTSIVLPKSEEISSFGNPGKENTSDCFENDEKKISITGLDRCSMLEIKDKILLNINWDFFQNSVILNNANMITYALQYIIQNEIIIPAIPNRLKSVTKKNKPNLKSPIRSRSNSPSQTIFAFRSRSKSPSGEGLGKKIKRGTRKRK